MDVGTYPADHQVAEALRWIVEAFARTGAQYQDVGELAARVYGATRPGRLFLPAHFFVRGLGAGGLAPEWGLLIGADFYAATFGTPLA